MIFLNFFTGLAFFALGLEAIFQLNRGGEFPLRKHLPWLALYGITCGISSWIDVFLAGITDPQAVLILGISRVIIQPIVGIVLLIFGWLILSHLTPLPSWAMIVPVVVIVPFAFVIVYASATFITPSPIEIPIEIWSRYLLYLPGSMMAGFGFIRQYQQQKKQGYSDVANLMLGAGVAFLIEAFVVGLVVPAAPYGPASYYNYDRGLINAFSGEGIISNQPYGLIPWLDYSSVLKTTGLPIEFWRMISTFAVTIFVMRSLEVFDKIQKREVKKLQEERDRAQKEAFEIQMNARQSAENWTNALVQINRRIVDLENVDTILLEITENAKALLHSDFIGLALFNEDRSCLNLRYYSNDQGAQSVDPGVMVTNPLILECVQNSSSYHSFENEPEESAAGICFYSEQPARSFAIVHLDLDNVPVGAMWLASYEVRPYSETDLIWLESLADQVVIAFQHGMMTAQLQSLSVIEERGRIARDMHDGVAQVLGYLNVQLQTLDALWRQDKKEAFERELIHMRQAIQSANADVRESILSMRTMLANDKGALAAMAEYIDEFGLQTGIEIHFSDQVQCEINLSSIAEVQLVCILQEALANVRKHAHANHVEVVLKKDLQPKGEFILLQVRDDGVGYEMHESRQSFGLKTMGERACSVNGDLQVHSAPNQGTTVLCTMPCLAPEKMMRTNRMVL